jgi:hypothetical protein
MRPQLGPNSTWGNYTLAYDEVRGTSVLVRGGRGWLDVHEYRGTPTGWTAVSTASAPAPTFGSLAYDMVRGCTLSFDGIPIGRETWEHDGLAWHRIQPSRSPGARVQHSMAYDLVRGRVVLFGGGVDPSDTWEWDGAT